MAYLHPFVDSPRQRFLKYSALVLLGCLHLWLITIFYANYSTRRTIEENLAQTGTGETFETLLFDARAGADIVREVGRQRCLQRDQITLYRLASLDFRQDLSRLYGLTLPLRREAIDFVRANASAFDVQATEKALEQSWGIPLLAELVARNPAVEPTPDQKANFEQRMSDRVAELRAELAKASGGELKQLVMDLGKSTDTDLSTVRTRFEALKKKDKGLFTLTGLDAIETALSRLNAHYAQAGLGKAPRRSLLIRRLAADQVGSLHGPETGLLAEFLGTIEGARRGSDLLQHLDCETADRQLVDEIKQAAKPVLEDVKHPGVLWAAYLGVRNSLPVQIALSPGDVFIGPFVRASTATQTLMIAMLFGSLGALCLQGLRLSRAGYWGSQSDPFWGEICMSIVLGMAAALIVYVLASLGNQLISDSARPAQSTPVGAGLVALLGFVSGLLNDDAFGRIRRFGQGWFRSDSPGTGDGSSTGVDAEFAGLLRSAKLDRFAELALHHLAGTRLAAKKGFTLFVPSDDWFEGRTLLQWQELADTTSSKAFDDFLARQLSTAGALSPADIRNLATKGDALVMSDGTRRPLSLAENEVVVSSSVTLDLKGAHVWRGGVVIPTRAAF